MSVDPTVSTLFFSGLEKIINTALAYDPGTKQKLSTLEGKQLALHCSSPTINAYFHISQGEFYVYSESDHSSDVTLSGNTLDLLSLLLKGEQSLAESGVSVSGKISILHEYQEAFKDLDIDWQEPLHRITGNVAGQLISETIQGLLNWGKDNVDVLQKRLPIYLTEELQAIPNRAELELFYENVDQIRADTHRTAAKIQQLRQKIKPQ